MLKSLYNKIRGPNPIKNKQKIKVYNTGALPPKLPGATRFVCISDTNGWLDLLDIPAGDIFIHAGNFTFEGDRFEVGHFNDQLYALPHKHKIIVHGPNDISFLEYDPDGYHYLDGIYLENAMTIAAGWRIYGASGLGRIDKCVSPDIIVLHSGYDFPELPECRVLICCQIDESVPLDSHYINPKALIVFDLWK